MKNLPAKRHTDLAAPKRDGATDMITNVSMSINREIREKPRFACDPSPWVEMEPTGRVSGEIEAEIVSPSVDYSQLFDRPIVLQWPERDMYVLLMLRRVEHRFEVTRPHVKIFGTVLRVADYGGVRRLTETEAKRSLMEPQKRLAESNGG